MLDKKAIRQGMLDLLCEKFPKAFFPLNKPSKPLDLNIFHEVLNNVDDKQKDFIVELKIFMAWYTNRKQYLQVVIAVNAKRVNIHGKEIGDVLESHRVYAKRQLEQLLKNEAELKKTKEREANQVKKRLNEKLRIAFEKRDVALKAKLASVALNVSKPKLTLKEVPNFGE